jgi:invasion protein IalB
MTNGMMQASTHVEAMRTKLTAALQRAVMAVVFAVTAAAGGGALLFAVDTASAQQPAKPAGPLVSPRPGSTVKAQFGDWKHECSKPPGSKNELCAITQDVSDESNSDIGVSVHIQKLAGGESILRVIAPLGVLLTHNLAVKVDGDYLGEAPFLRCYVLGCQAQIEIDEKLRGRLTSGKTMLLVIHRTTEQGVGIPISLSGFQQAFGALK